MNYFAIIPSINDIQSIRKHVNEKIDSHGVTLIICDRHENITSDIDI